MKRTDILTLDMLEECKRKLDQADVPTQNRYVYFPWETEPMTTTIVTETTEVKDLTAQEIMDKLDGGRYISKTGDYIYSRDWGDEVEILKNPAKHGYDDDSGVTLTAEDLTEYTNLVNFVKTYRESSQQESSVKRAVDKVNGKTRCTDWGFPILSI